MADTTVDFKLRVPTTMESISLSQYQRYLDILKKNEGAEDSDFVSMKFVEIFCNTSLDAIQHVHFSVFDEIGKILNKAFKEETPLVRHFKMGDVELGFMPNISKMSIGEYIDIEQNIGDFKTIHKAMAVLFRPIKKKKGDRYTIKKYNPTDSVAEAMKEMPLNVVLGARVFFYHLGNDLLLHTLSYFRQEIKKTKDKEIIQKLQHLVESGDGIHQSMLSLKELPKI